jgi:hypothetical protein
VRCTELGKELEDLQNKQVEEERRGGPAVLLASYVRVQGGLASYCAWRENALAEALRNVKAESGATADSQQRRWSDFLIQKGSEAFNTLWALPSSDPDPLKQLFERIAQIESESFKALSQMELARFQGQVRQFITELDNKLDDLSDTWSTISGSVERQDGEIATLRVQVLDMFRSEVEELRGWPPKLEAAALKLVELWGKFDEASPDPSLAPAVTAAIEAINLLQQGLEKVTRNVLPLYSNKATNHALFANTRENVKSYLDRVNKDAIAKQYSEACRAAQDRAAHCPTEGQKKDARRLVEQAARETEAIVAEFNSKFDQFYNRFDGKFVGKVSDATVEALVDQAHFNQFWSDAKSLDLPGEFRSTADGLARCEQLSLDRVSDDQRRRMQELIKTRLAPLKERIRAMDPSFFERFKTQFIDAPLAQMRDRVKNLSGYSK